MKIAATNNLVAILVATPELRQVAAEMLSGITPLMFDTRQLERLTAEGILEAVIVSVDSNPIYCAWLHTTVDSGLHINAAVQLASGGYFNEFAQSMESYAKNRGCAYIRFNTKRIGLIAKAELQGYQADSITMIKKL